MSRSARRERGRAGVPEHPAGQPLLQRKTEKPRAAQTVPPLVQDVLGFGHDFSAVRTHTAQQATAPKPVDLTYHPKLEMPDPNRLPPDFWKPLPPLPKGSEPKSVIDVVAEKFLDPVIDTVASKLSKEWRDRIKRGARAAVESGVAKGARAGAEAAGVSDKATLDAIEKAAEAAIQQGGKPK